LPASQALIGSLWIFDLFRLDSWKQHMSMRRGFQLRSHGIVAAIVERVLASGRATLQDGGTANREPVGLAPDPTATHEAVVQVYCARCSGWAGHLGVHTWIAVKPAGAKAYTVFEVTYPHLRRRGSAIAMRKRTPDARWFGHVPELLADKRGDGVGVLIDLTHKIALEYPYAGDYVVWPGPNSNTFTAYVGRALPELELDLPPTAIGKDYLGDRLVATAPSGRGVQVSLFGLLGVLTSSVEGFEVNVLGLTVGVDPFTPALKLPLIGRLGATRSNGSGARAGVATDPS
jgi:hypothetical protein